MKHSKSALRVRALTRRAPRVPLIASALLALSLLVPMVAQSNADGYIFGRVAATAAGTTLVATNLDTGLHREARPNANGDFRIGLLPVGRYTITLRRAGQPDEVSEPVNVHVGTGSSVLFVASLPAAYDNIVLEKVTVSAGRAPRVDLSTTESATVFRAETITQLPVERNLSGVALLAPGTARGVAAFGDLVSFGGSSVAENSYFVNGFNITSFSDGLGYAQVPFEFYDNFQVKTGGYSAEFGRSTGGVQNSTTKRGSNTREEGTNAFWTPGSLSAHATNRPFNRGWSRDGNVHASGPLIKNKLFVYGLYNVRRSFSESASSYGLSRSTSKDPFWGAKVDGNISDRHSLELTAFSDKGKTAAESFSYDYRSRTINFSRGVTDRLRGGDTYIARYTGVFTDNFTLSLLGGQGDARFTNRGAGDAYPYVVDGRSGSSVQLGRATSPSSIVAAERRHAYRLDGEYTLGGHRFRFGLDREDTNLYHARQYSGGFLWRYSVTARANQALANGAVVPVAGTQIARRVVNQDGGDFRTLNDAFYAEDNWRLLDGRLLLNLGARRDGFDNRNVNGQTFVKISNQIGPRAGATFDVEKNGRSKLFASYGRYFLPIPATTNWVLAGNWLYYDEYYVLNGLAPDSGPILGAQLGGRTTFVNGSVPDPRKSVDHNLKPMHQDEFILGYQRSLSKNWTVGLRGIYRDLPVVQEDEYIDAALNDYARANGIKGFAAGGLDYGILTNPGRPMTITVDFGDGKGPRDVSFAPAQLKYPQAQRTYWAAELYFEKVHDGKWFLQGSYTLSHSYGSDEGWTHSDAGDGGINSSAFDLLGTTDGARGDLPNDHRHKFKLFGAYAFTRAWQAGTNLQVASGRPMNAFGFHPTDPIANSYGPTSFYDNGKLVPRGSRGRTPWITEWSLNLRYTPAWSGRAHTTFGVDVFNVLNLQRATEVNQTAELAAGVPDPNYNTPYQYQSPRSVRFSIDLKF